MDKEKDYTTIRIKRKDHYFLRLFCQFNEIELEDYLETLINKDENLNKFIQQVEQVKKLKDYSQ